MGHMRRWRLRHAWTPFYIASPHSAHKNLALLAITAGKHVLIEKPMAASAAEAQVIADAARAAGVMAIEQAHPDFGGQHPPDGGVEYLLIHQAGLDGVHRLGVADDKAVKAPRIAQHLGQQPVVPGGWYAVEVHVSSHDVPGAASTAALNGGR